MPTFPCELEGSSIVLVGSFNPAIFQPAWLLGQGLVGQADAEAAELEIITPEITVVRIGQVRLLVRPSRFQAETLLGEASGPLRDIVVGASLRGLKVSE